MGKFCPLSNAIIYMRWGGVTQIMDKIAKKTIIVHILRILYCFTSFEYPVTQTHIANYLKDIDIPCDRKTVGRNIKYLIDMGLPIMLSNGVKRGYYYDIENDNFFTKNYKIFRRY